MTQGSGSRRGLALVLCLCLMVPYLPVPGHAEGCGHVHGEACYQEVTQCVHTHGDACWSDPEARETGEEPDACAHVCGEDTGCVTEELNCPHVHDDTCGEQPQEEPEPEPEEPEPEEPKSEEPEEPEEPQEPKDEEHKQEEENQPLVISRWEWVDEEEILDPETGVLCLSSEEPILFEQVVELLPKAILATVGEEPQTIPLGPWDPKDYPQETGANSGSYLIEATLPEGNTLSEDAAPLTLHLEFAQAQALAECGHENVNMDTGKCPDCDEQVYEAKIGNTGYATLEEALNAAQEDGNKDCTVTMLCDVNADDELRDSIEVSGGTFTLDLNGKKLVGMQITLRQGELTVRNGSISAGYPLTVKNGLLKIESGYYRGGAAALNIQGGTVVLSGGRFRGGDDVFFIKQDEPIMNLLADGKAFFEEVENGDDVLVDASVSTLKPGTYYVGDHPHSYSATTGKCDCGRTIPQAKLDTAPAAAKLTYNGRSQNLVEPGVTTGGTLLYSLAENGTYTETIPTGKNADTYTVWYYVLGTPGKYYNTEKKSLTVTVAKKDLTPVVTIPDRDFDGTKAVIGATVTLEGKENGDELTYTLGTLEFDGAIPGKRTARLTGTPKLEGKDAGNYDLKAPTGLTGKINATSRYLDVTDSLPNADSVTIDGEEYQVKVESGKRYVRLPDTGSLLTVYTYQTNADNKTYPDTMRVFAIDRQGSGSTLAEIPEFEDLLFYEGCAIRLNGTKGIRMLTSISQVNKKALAGKGLAGYTLVEYGTVIARESDLGGRTLNLQNVKSNNYNSAYSKAEKKDPVFKVENGRMQYTNVLVNFQPGDYQTELVLRPYMKLLDANGNEVILYGGTVTRSIYYIAQQNIGEYKPGSAGYKYLQEILNG